MEKVKLPREVAEALDEARKWADTYGISAEHVAWCIPNKNMTEKHGEYWKTLYDFGNNGGFLKLIDALRYGYEIEDEPITVTITPVQQKSLREFCRDQIRLENSTHVFVVRKALDILGITIDGVNA